MAAMTSLGKARDAAVPFEEASGSMLRELQGALGAMVSRLPGKNARAVDLQRALGIDKKLGWQLFTFVSAAHPLEEIANVPSAASMRRIIQAAARRKVPASVTQGAATAFERFEAFVVENGADRSELVSLARGLSADIDPQHELKIRRDLFRGTAHVWGVQVGTVVRTGVIHPSTAGRGGSEDALVVVGYIGLQRLRRGAPVAIAASIGVHNEPAEGTSGGGAREGTGIGASTPAGHRINAMKVLEEYSSRPLPDMLARADSDGSIETELMFPPSGRAGAISLFTAQHIASAWEGKQAEEGLNTLVKLPAKTYVSELLVPAGRTDPGTARVSVYGRRGAVERVHDLRAVDLLPQRETITYLGALDGPPELAEAPRHAEAVRHMLREQGWDGTRFDVYRCTVRYPVLHTMIRVAVDVARA